MTADAFLLSALPSGRPRMQFCFLVLLGVWAASCGAGLRAGLAFVSALETRVVGFGAPRRRPAGHLGVGVCRRVATSGGLGRLVGSGFESVLGQGARRKTHILILHSSPCGMQCSTLAAALRDTFPISLNKRSVLRDSMHCSSHYAEAVVPAFVAFLVLARVALRVEAKPSPKSHFQVRPWAECFLFGFILEFLKISRMHYFCILLVSDTFPQNPHPR